MRAFFGKLVGGGTESLVTVVAQVEEKKAVVKKTITEQERLLRISQAANFKAKQEIYKGGSLEAGDQESAGAATAEKFSFLHKHKVHKPVIQGDLPEHTVNSSARPSLFNERCVKMPSKPAPVAQAADTTVTPPTATM